MEATAGTQTNLISIDDDWDWIVDTSASNHMTSSLHMLKAYRLVPQSNKSKVHLRTGNVFSHIIILCV